MCLILFSLSNSEDYRLILAANRDEFYDRPTARMQAWEDHPYIFAGRDLAQGGTWLGITKSGRFAAVTNYRDPSQPKGKYSRGHLVSDFLRGDESVEEYLKFIKSRADNYTGFNLLLGDFSNGSNDMFYFSNRAKEAQNLAPGVYGLSNHLLETQWPKVKLGKEHFTNTTSKTFSADDLFEIMQNEQQADDADLPDTGIGYEREKAISPMFIKTDIYGTRCISVITIDKTGNVFFAEKGLPMDSENSQVTKEFKL